MMARDGLRVTAAVERRAGTFGGLLSDRRFVLALLGLGGLAFLARLIPLLVGGGLTGFIDYDDGVYMGSALALVRGRIVYRDFYMLHPPGIVYVLSPFALLSFFVSDATAFAAARVGMVLLGALNTILVALLAVRVSRLAAFAAGGLYAVWTVPIYVERSTWLIGPQNTALLLALLVLAPPAVAATATPQRPIGARRAALAGILLGVCGAIQIWAAAPAAIIFAWLLYRTRRQPGGWLKPAAAYVAGGLATIAVLFLPFFLAAGTKMFRIIILDQLGRATDRVALLPRLRALEGLPHGVGGPIFNVIIVAAAVAAMLAVLAVAWRQPAVRFWAALLAAQVAVLLATPSFFRHYAGWYAPLAALWAGIVVASLGDAIASQRRTWLAVRGAYGVVLVGLLAITLAPVYPSLSPATRPFPADAVAAALAGARCPTSDSPTLLILTGEMRRMIENGCPLLVSPTGVSYDVDRGPGPTRLTRPNQLEYQAIMRDYYAGSDAAAFIRADSSNGLSAATWAAIRAKLPVEIHIGRVRIFLPAD